jgi:recombination protein RecA
LPIAIDRKFNRKTYVRIFLVHSASYGISRPNYEASCSQFQLQEVFDIGEYKANVVWPCLMPASAQIRAEIEAALAQRIPSALTPQPRAIRPIAATGIAQIDELLRGGLPIGAITEVVGPQCSGRTTLALALLARITLQGKVCAWIDVSDTLHPESAAAAGIDLDRLLWVRCGDAASHPNEIVVDTQRSAQSPQTTRLQFGGNSPHPRTESKGLPSALGDLLGTKAKYRRDKIIGTRGAPNRPPTTVSSAASDKNSPKEQVASDRLPARRGSHVLEQREAYEPRCAEPQRKLRPQTNHVEPVAIASGHCNSTTLSAPKPWSRLDQALRATDLLLQAGGFSAIVLDMGSIAPEYASRVPLATWFRYRAAAERTQSSFLMLTQHSCSKSSAGVVLCLDAATPVEAGATVFAGLENHVKLSRRRFEQEDSNVIPIRKPPERITAVEWTSRTTWAGGR